MQISHAGLYKLIKAHEALVKSSCTVGTASVFSDWEVGIYSLFMGCDLTGAICQRTDFRYTNLTRTKLNGANLRGARFDATTKLDGTEFYGAEMDATTDFTGADLSNIKCRMEDFINVNLLKVGRNKIPDTLYGLYDVQLRESKREQQSWIEDYHAAGRGKKQRNLGKSRFDI